MARKPRSHEEMNNTDKIATEPTDGDDESIIDRRSYLKLAGATAATAVATTGMASAAGDYDVIEVGAGETFRKTISDGETWSNKLIDITASGASYYIDARANNFEIRNIGFRGKLDRQGDPGQQNFVTTVDRADATGLIENFYHPGTSYPRSVSPYPSGLYVFPSHAGDLEIRNWYVVDLPSHAVYGSAPGNPSNHSFKAGSGGTVRIHDSYCADLENSGWRIGSDGSYVDNSVAFRTARGIWAYYEDVEVRNSDIGDNSVDIHVGNSSWGNTGTCTVKNTRFDTQNEVSGGTLSGSSVGMPQERVPTGCPTSPEEAASGGGNTDSPSGGGNTGSKDGSKDLPENTLTITGQGEPANYYVETSGPIEQNPERADLESYDSINGTTASGWVTQPEHVDGYRFDGELVDIGFEQGRATVEVNGKEIDPSNFGDNNNDSSNSGDNNNDSPNSGDNNNDSPNSGDNNNDSPNLGDNNSGSIDEWIDGWFSDFGSF